MNPYDAPNPDQFAGITAEPKPGAVPKMQYLYTFQFITESPGWMTNVLVCGLAMFVPVVGPLVVVGWLFTVVEYLHRRAGPAYPDFDFDKLGEYLGRGVWPFIVQLIVQAVMMPVMMVLIYAPMICAGIMGAAMEEAGGDGAVIGLCMATGMFLMFGGVILFSVLAGMIITPMSLAAGLAQEIGPAFKVDFIKDFVGKMWKEMLLGFLFFMLASQVLSMVGLLLFCVGIIPVAAAVGMAYHHMLYQYYEIYLARGGKPIPLKEPGK